MNGVGQKRVLVVEDHPDLRSVVCEALSNAGYDVVSSADARAAVEQLDATPPDLALIDLVLPEGGSFDLCELIRSSPKLGETRILVMSGRSLPTDRANAEEAGADAFLTKPFTVETLLAEVHRVLFNLSPRNEAA